jgi:hypothetical protein
LADTNRVTASDWLPPFNFAGCRAGLDPFLPVAIF